MLISRVSAVNHNSNINTSFSGKSKLIRKAKKLPENILAIATKSKAGTRLSYEEFTDLYSYINSRFAEMSVKTFADKLRALDSKMPFVKKLNVNERARIIVKINDDGYRWKS